MSNRWGTDCAPHSILYVKYNDKFRTRIRCPPHWWSLNTKDISRGQRAGTATLLCGSDSDLDESRVQSIIDRDVSGHPWNVNCISANYFNFKDENATHVFRFTEQWPFRDCNQLQITKHVFSTQWLVDVFWFVSDLLFLLSLDGICNRGLIIWAKGLPLTAGFVSRGHLGNPPIARRWYPWIVSKTRRTTQSFRAFLPKKKWHL